MTTTRPARAGVVRFRSAAIVPFVAGVWRAAVRVMTRSPIVLLRQFRAAMQNVCGGSAPSRPQDGFGDIDPETAGRAAAAAETASARFQGMIDAVSRNAGLTPADRAAQISALRKQQAAAAANASRAVMDEAKGKAKGRRTMKKNMR